VSDPEPKASGGRFLTGTTGVLAVYVVSRLLVAAATGVVGALKLSGARCGDEVPRPIEGYAALTRCWDVRWYLQAATAGYPHGLPAGGNGQTTLAFFPGYPATIAAVHALGVSPLVAAVAVSLIAGGIATVLVYRLGLLVSSPAAAERAAVLFAVFPGAVVLSWGYSESLAAAFAAAALLLLHRRCWASAGVVAAVAGTIRADVWLALTAAALVAAWVSVRDGDRRALLAPALAPLGGLAFVGFVWYWTGSPGTWRQTQSRGWNQHFDWGRGAFGSLHVFGDPLASPFRVILVTAVIFLAVALVAMVRRPPPRPWTAYVVVLVAISLTSSQVGFRPRAELLLLPAFVAVGDWLSGPTGRRLTPILIAVLATGQALLLVLWLGMPLIPPP
jgi:hypothetical protein